MILKLIISLLVGFAAWFLAACFIHGTVNAGSYSASYAILIAVVCAAVTWRKVEE